MPTCPHYMPMILYHQIHIGDDIIVNEKKVLCSKMNRVFYLSTSISGSNKQITAPKNPHIKTVQFLYDSDKTFHWKMWVFCTNRRIISGVVIFLHRKNLKPNVKNILTSVFGLSLFQMAIRMPISIMASGHWSKIIYLIPTDLIFLISVGRKSILRQTVKR